MIKKIPRLLRCCQKLKEGEKKKTGGEKRDCVSERGREGKGGGGGGPGG